MESYPELAAMSKVYSITSSEHCSVDAHTVAYKWCYEMFADLELYVDFCSDRQQAYESGDAYERKLEEMRNKHNQR